MSMCRGGGGEAPVSGGRPLCRGVPGPGAAREGGGGGGRPGGSDHGDKQTGHVRRSLPCLSCTAAGTREEGGGEKKGLLSPHTHRAPGARLRPARRGAGGPDTHRRILQLTLQRAAPRPERAGPTHFGNRGGRALDTDYPLSFTYTLLCDSKVLADLDVTQSPPSLVVAQGDQAKLNCLFSASDSHVKGAVSWYKTAPEENGRYKTAPEENRSSHHVIPLRGRFSLTFPRAFLSEGDGSLIISNVSWEDAGIYYCKVLVWEKEEEQGNGTRLIVYTRPSQPEIYRKVPATTDEEVTLTCRTSGFYPGDVRMSWNSSDIPLPESGPLQIWKSQHGISQADLPLVLPAGFRSQQLQISCIVCHLSLAEPLYANYSHNIPEYKATEYQLVEYLNILKLCLIFALTVSILLTVIKRHNSK